MTEQLQALLEALEAGKNPPAKTEYEAQTLQEILESLAVWCSVNGGSSEGLEIVLPETAYNAFAHSLRCKERITFKDFPDDTENPAPSPLSDLVTFYCTSGTIGIHSSKNSKVSK